MQDINPKRARLNPMAVFLTPDTVLEHPRLTREEKIDILQRWKYDACELEVAEEENMGGGEPSTLERVLKALMALGVETDLEHPPPTKHGTS